MSELKDIIPLLPGPMATTLAAAYGLALLLPKTFDAWRSARGYSYEREKRQLELLKLRYEIEALRKEKGLEDLSQTILTGEASAALDRTAAPGAVSTTRTRRFLLGSLGGALLPLFKITLVGSLGPGRPWAAYLGMGASIALIAGIGGLLVIWLANRATPRWALPVIGLSGSLVLLSLISAATSSSPPAR